MKASTVSDDGLIEPQASLMRSGNQAVMANLAVRHQVQRQDLSADKTPQPPKSNAISLAQMFEGVLDLRDRELRGVD
ncbi:uncharacterized protein LACBIDRAFT_298206 [Laccaria bicolor S238N-H82]|uniref:Predicted protein n=1 Tax=Laccaria bicolor (strain S238N-H82 / ATCC MYA-4686) TaxID=486041 RepID=B0DCG3_LACBS|nr:uncharacterized protein LACBIDRAFT_298206 [Laccaria bicolor S238N-H82]EDR07727.1 predicted protein [Laccaria bicolor S238N-H82]|eukprot:XP_001881516.1 predicted protein [Laccaria bicolor S238N-H82]